MMTLTAMQKYKTYKWSGNPFFGDIPSCWDIYPLFKIAKIKSIINKQDEELLSVYLDRGVIKFSDVDEKRTNGTSLDLSKYQFVEKGDFVLNNQQAWRGSVGVSNHIGIVSPAYLVLSLSKEINPKYANYLFRDGSMVSQYLICSKGVGTIQRNLYWPHLRRTIVALPSYIEQTAIANFLDAKTTQIDEAIAIKEQQIALLNERKQILIQQAVTQGLDPTVPMKDSGVDWVGDIPEHWSLQPGFIVFNENKKSNKGMIESQVLSLSYGKIIVKAKEKLNGLVPESFETYQVVSPGNIIIRCTDLQNDKTSLRTGFVKNHGIITSAYLCLNISLEQNAEYIHYFLHALDVCKEIYRYGSGLRQSLSFSDFKRMLVIAPPIEEQDQIVTFIREQEENTMSAVELLKTQIEKLTEYKKSLIHSAVTGNIKVI
ncbi:restriction endonuclease subunit S [Aeromonas sp. MaB10011B]|uniref:restriction endonuclease subunit S n=1 Tax=Aeromonas TaxID=642 RepID=UPI001B3315D0|nr:MULTISPECIES: restriction endonuclease subunit S [unclassified Aeromonas]MBP4068736.1 restriction endonuclease subunit S [Aeromonas sp. MaB10011B]MBP4081982.1 restriction endonuclease subunit S [Aeromonas sp. MrichA-1]